MRFILYIFLLVLLNSCGFKPLLAKNNYGHIITEIQLVEVTGTDSDRLERIILESLGYSSNPLYQLKIHVDKKISQMAIKEDSQSTRYKVTLHLNYDLIYTENQKSLDAGSIFLSNSYDIVTSEYANYISDRYVSDNILKELTEELKNRLFLVLSSGDK